jgi:hypothetical protein
MPEGSAEEDGDHHQVAGAEGAVEPVGVAEARGEGAQSRADAIGDEGQAVAGPRLVGLEELGVGVFEDGRLDGVEGSEHPGDGAGARVGVVGEEAGVVRREVEDDRAGLEEDERAVLVGRDRAEGMQGEMRGFLEGAERDQAHRVGLADFFERPANARVAGEALAAVGRTLERGDRDGHGTASERTTRRSRRRRGRGGARRRARSRRDARRRRGGGSRGARGGGAACGAGGAA